MPDSNNNRKGSQQEFELAYYTKELGKTLQRQLLQQQLAQLRDPASVRSARSEDAPPAQDTPPAQNAGAP